MKRFLDIRDIRKAKAAIINVGGVKEVKFVGFKVSPSQPTDAQVAKINQFTRRPFTADEIYVGQLRLSNNCIDRDNERFSEEILQRFVATTLRRTMLFDHNRKSQESAVGKFFDVELERMPLQQAIAETGEELALPDGITEVWFHSPWFYIPRAGVDDKTIVKIDAGIYDFGSIGFRAESLVPVMDKEGDIRFWEYRGNGRNTEMTEGSLVYLGAQYGMAVKSYGDDEAKKQFKQEPPTKAFEIDNENEGGNEKMDWKELQKILQRIFRNKNFTQENLEDDVKTALDEHVSSKVPAAVAEAKRPLETQIAELIPLAEEGKTYRKSLVEQYATLKAKLGDIDEKPETREKTLKIAGNFDIDFLLEEINILGKRVEEKFPSDLQLKGGDIKDRSAAGEKNNNPLIPEE